MPTLVMTGCEAPVASTRAGLAGLVATTLGSETGPDEPERC